MHSSLSIRSKNGSGAADKGPPKHRFTLSSLRTPMEKDLSKKLYKLIKSETHAIEAYESAGRERAAIATQLSEWGEETNDDAISDLSDKLGVLLSEIAEQEDMFAHNLEESRVVLKSIRNTERSVQPTRDNKAKITDEIAKLKHKEPQSTKIPELEQELVRAEAQTLVAEAQLTNVTRQKFKESYDLHFAATIERAEKQILLAQQARRLLMLLDDTPIVPGDVNQPYENTEAAHQILSDAEDRLKAWEPTHEPIPSQSQHLNSNAMPGTQPVATEGSSFVPTEGSTVGTATTSEVPYTTETEAKEAVAA